MSQNPKNNDIPSIYEAIGSAISNWTRVEIQLYQIFSISLSLTIMQPGGGFSSGNAPFAVLDAVDGFRAKLLMIDAALSTALNGLDSEAQSILNEWAKERKKVTSLHGNRSSLAHWTVARQVDFNQRTRVVLRPPIYSSRMHPEGYTETDIRGWEEAFKGAATRLEGLVARLASHQGLQRKFLAQAASQIRCSLPASQPLLEYLECELSSGR